MAPFRTDIPVPLANYLLPGERVVVAVHHHWVRIAEPVGSAVVGLVVALWVDSNITAATQFLATILWYVFFFLTARALWNILEWRHDWFVATDKRLLLRYGLVTHKVAMMPLLKVTDMSFVRSIPGQLLGFGRFIMESAGQDQAMRVVNWVPYPDETYRAICAEIFRFPPPGSAGSIGGPGNSGGSGTTPSGRPGNEPPTGGPGADTLDEPTPTYDPVVPYADDRDVPTVPPYHEYPDVPPIQSAVQDRLNSWSRAVPIHSGEQVYASEDIREQQRGAKTGPIPQRRWRRHRPEGD